MQRLCRHYSFRKFYRLILPLLNGKSGTQGIVETFFPITLILFSTLITFDEDEKEKNCLVSVYLQ